MKVNLTSNSATIYSKYIVLVLFFFGLISLFIFPLPKNFIEILPNEDFSFLIIASICLILVIYNSLRLKFVKGDNRFLYVKNYKSEIAIPLENLLKVKESRFPFHIITIKLKEETQYGKKIAFIPYSKWFLFGSDHPVLKEIQSYIDKRNSDNLPLD